MDVATYDIEEAVARGARLLDEKRFGWWERVDPATLPKTMSRYCGCVVGQEFGIADYGGYVAAVERLTGAPFETTDADEVYGFDLPGKIETRPMTVTYGRLGQAWARAINERRGNA